MKHLSAIILAILFNMSLFATPSQNKIVVAIDGSGDFKSIQEAINSVPDNQSARTTIFVKNGVYHEKVMVSSSKLNITLIGESAERTIISNSDYNPKVVGKDTITTWSSYTFAVDAEGFIGENITFENASGRVGQAVAVRVMSDRVVFKNCRFLGNQDTLFAHGIGRIYFKDCYIEGTTDYIFGSAVALFENCHIHSKINSYITAASTPMGNKYGYVFKNCTLTADSSAKKVFLGRPWRPYAKTVYINCSMGDFILPSGWNNWGSTEKEKTTFYAEYKNTGSGSKPEARAQWSKQLTDAEAAEYSIEKIFARTSVPIPVVGLGAWVPDIK